MSKKGLYLAVLLVVIASAGFLGFGTKASSEDSNSCVTEKCHASLLKAKTVHPAAQMGCDSCHQSDGSPHPQKGKQTFKLTQQVPDLCYGCHNPFGKKKHIHPPVKDGMCTTCHNPHASDNEKLLVQPMKDLCTMCHADKLQHKVLHGPASTGDCTMCHNPHESDNDKLLVKEQPDLCYTCHSDMQETMKKKDVHPAVLSGCTSCHNPHGSEHKRMLSDDVPQLCFQCHPQIQETVEKAKSSHPPVKSEKSCITCHSPHASDASKLLPLEGKALCLSCHKTLIKKDQTVLHGPIRDGKCTPCHNPHGSPYFKLLVKEFPEDLYPSYNENEYELCFSCHNRDLLRYPDTSFATNFRDGERNLHYLHVNRKEKSRSCILCHTPHASSSPKLIADKVPFGQWAYPLKYIKTDTGGSCSPGCHKTVFYDRKTPGKTLVEPPKPIDKQKK
jgi:predicted CXXCH cytochrome family protein